MATQQMTEREMKSVFGPITDGTITYTAIDQAEIRRLMKQVGAAKIQAMAAIQLMEETVQQIASLSATDPPAPSIQGVRVLDNEGEPYP